MAYCVLCQEGHEMTDNCMKYVVCKECGEMGHLSIQCSKNKPIPPTFQASQPAPVLVPTPAPPSQDQETTSTQDRIPMNSVHDSDKVPESTSFDIRHVFDTDSDNDSIDRDKNDNPSTSDGANDNVKTIDEVVWDETIDNDLKNISKVDVLSNKSVRQEVVELAKEYGIDVCHSFLNPPGYEYKIGQRADEGDFSVCLSLTRDDQEQKFHGKGTVPYAAIREAYKKAKKFLISTNGEFIPLPAVENELGNSNFRGEKRKHLNLLELGVEPDVDTATRIVIPGEPSKCFTDILTVVEPQPNKRLRHYSEEYMELESTELYLKMESDAETEPDLVIDISSDSEGEKNWELTGEMRSRAKTTDDIELETVLEGNLSGLVHGERKSDELINHVLLSNDINETIDTISLGVDEALTIAQDNEVLNEALKVLKKKKQCLSSDKLYKLLFVHIETFRSSKSSSTQLTQIGCCSGSSTSDFFCAIQPSGLSKYLGKYKLGGDLLRALHMTEEEDERFQFRSQFEIVTPEKRIYCMSEKEACQRLLEFLKEYGNCVLCCVDEDTMAILAKKLRDIWKKEFKETVVGYTYWRRILKYLYVPGYNEVELEEFYFEIRKSELPNYLSAKDIATILNKSVEEVISKYWHSGNQNMRNKFICKTSKKIGELPRPGKKPYDRKTLIEDLEVYSSFRPSVSTTISAEKSEQITLSSGSESESEESTSASEHPINNLKNKESDCLIEVISDSEEGEKNCAYIRDVNKRGRAAEAAAVQSNNDHGLLNAQNLKLVVRFNIPKANCPECNAPNLTIMTIRKHVAEYHKEKEKTLLLVCQFCFEANVAADFLRHMKVVHPELIQAEHQLDRTAASAVARSHPEVIPAKHQLHSIVLREVGMGHLKKTNQLDRAASATSAAARSSTVKARSASKAAADPDPYVAVAQARQPEKMILCPVCNGTKVKVVNLGKHMIKCHSKHEKLIDCPICSRKLVALDLSEHLNTSHSDFYLDQSAFKKYAKYTPATVTATGALHDVETHHGNLVPARKVVPQVWRQPQPLMCQPGFDPRFAPQHQPFYPRGPRLPYFPMQGGPKFGQSMTNGRSHFRPPYMSPPPYMPNGNYK